MMCEFATEAPRNRPRVAIEGRFSFPDGPRPVSWYASAAVDRRSGSSPGPPSHRPDHPFEHTEHPHSGVNYDR